MKDKLIIFTGPTGVGKTSYSIDLAKSFSGEIVSCDSFQIYKGLDIGTAKIREEEKKGIVHHNIDIIEADDYYNVALFKKQTEDIISDIISRGQVAILVGGTGLYVHSLIYDLDFGVEADMDLRKDLEAYVEKEGLDSLYNRLVEIDPKIKESLDMNNRHRVIRAYEIYLKTRQMPSESLKNFRSPNKKYDFLYIVLNQDRQLLYENINKRVDQMIGQGLVEEIKGLLKDGYGFDLRSFKAIGYKEFKPYFQKQATLDQVLETIKKNTRNYAKRQLTWFRREKNAVWVNKDDFSSRDQCLKYIIKLTKEFLFE